MIMAGGTGGHVFPALSLADWLRQRGFRIVWLGTHRGIEARLVPAAGIDIGSPCAPSGAINPSLWWGSAVMSQVRVA